MPAYIHVSQSVKILRLFTNSIHANTLEQMKFDTIEAANKFIEEYVKFFRETCCKMASCTWEEFSSEWGPLENNVLPFDISIQANPVYNIVHLVAFQSYEVK